MGKSLASLFFLTHSVVIIVITNETITFVYLPADIISDNDFAASFFSATFRIRNMATSMLGEIYRTQYFADWSVRCTRDVIQPTAAVSALPHTPAEPLKMASNIT